MSDPAVCVGGDPDGDLAGLGELDGVADEVGQHLTQAVRVAAHHGRDRVLERPPSAPALWSGPTGPAGRPPRRRPSAGRTRCPRPRAAPSRSWRSRGSPLMTFISASPDLAQRLREATLVGVEIGVQQELGPADDAAHRRTDLVAHVREEVRLEPRRLGGVVAGLHHGCLCLRLGGDVGERPDPPGHGWPSSSSTGRGGQHRDAGDPPGARILTREENSSPAHMGLVELGGGRGVLLGVEHHVPLRSDRVGAGDAGDLGPPRVGVDVAVLAHRSGRSRSARPR